MSWACRRDERAERHRHRPLGPGGQGSGAAHPQTTGRGLLGSGPYVSGHCPLSPLALAASIQLDASLPNFLVQEHNEVNDYRKGGRTLIGKGYLWEPFVLDGEGCVAVPQGPGLGIELDEEGWSGYWPCPGTSAESERGKRVSGGRSAGGREMRTPQIARSSTFRKSRTSGYLRKKSGYTAECFTVSR